VCNGDGNTEVVRVTFDPSITSYEQVLGAFWEVSGSRAATRRQKAQYKSAIFFSSEEQRGAAVASLAARAAGLKDGEDLVTEVLPMGPWYDAEERHQGRVAKHRAAKAARADAAQGWVDAWTATTEPSE